MKAIASKRRRFGYRRIDVLSERKGMTMHHKKLYSLYCEERLGVKQLKGPQKSAWVMNADASRPPARRTLVLRFCVWQGFVTSQLSG